MKKQGNRIQNINPAFLEDSNSGKIELHDLDYYVNGIRKGDKIVLSKAITLVESKIQAHKRLGADILNACLKNKTKSIRIGISGSPGVGKSTFIESLGMYLLGLGKKPAILAIDPSSSVSKGSVLGDKTRMPRLSLESSAYIRPSAAGGELGGIQRNTKESIVLCEAAGYDVILIETVGVGQAEIKVHSMVDFFILLILPGAGDELQGIKRGIVELADLILVNKSDGERIKLAKQTRQAYSNALHLMGQKENGWITPVQSISSIDEIGLEGAWQIVLKYFETQLEETIQRHRAEQDLLWFEDQARRFLLDEAFKKKEISNFYSQIVKRVNTQEYSIFSAFDQFQNKIRGLLK